MDDKSHDHEIQLAIGNTHEVMKDIKAAQCAQALRRMMGNGDNDALMAIFVTCRGLNDLAEEKKKRDKKALEGALRVNRMLSEIQLQAMAMVEDIRDRIADIEDILAPELAKAREALQEALDRAHTLDGQPVFIYEDGTYRSADGRELSEVEKERVEFSDDPLSGEIYDIRKKDAERLEAMQETLTQHKTRVIEIEQEIPEASDEEAKELLEELTDIQMEVEEASKGISSEIKQHSNLEISELTQNQVPDLKL